MNLLCVEPGSLAWKNKEASGRLRSASGEIKAQREQSPQLLRAWAWVQPRAFCLEENYYQAGQTIGGTLRAKHDSIRPPNALGINSEILQPAFKALYVPPSTGLVTAQVPHHTELVLLTSATCSSSPMQFALSD